MSAPPFVSIIVPCFNEAKCIEECLDSILSQDYPLQRMEILIADGESTDGTREIVERYAAAHPEANIQVIRNPDRIQAAGCNRAIVASRGEIIVRLDAHARYQSDYVRSCVTMLESTGALIVGGAQRPAWRTPFQRAIVAALQSPLAVGGAAYRNPNRQGFVDTVWLVAALQSPLAVGGAAYRNPNRQGFVDTVWLGAFRRNAFEDVGMFDPRAITNEDAELNHRMLRSGGKIYLSRDIVGYYYPRESLTALARQYFRYGTGRARTTLKHRRLQTLRPLAPVSLLLVLVGLAITSLFTPWAEAALATVTVVYLASLVAESTRLCIRHGFGLLPDLLAIFPTIHFAWATGFLYGLGRYALRPDWDETPLRLPRRFHDESPKRV